MTALTGIRRRTVPQRPSAPTAQTQAQVAQGQVLPVQLGGTGETTLPELRAALDVPSLSGDNTFTGANTFSGTVVAGRVDASAESTFVTLIAADIDALGRMACLGGLSVQHVAKTADYEVATTDCIVNVTANSPTITLHTAVGSMGVASGLSDGHLLIIKNSGAGTITLATTSSQTIDGAAPGTIAAGAVLRLFSDGANWQSW